jgi:hypothetical protein
MSRTKIKVIAVQVEKSIKCLEKKSIKYLKVIALQDIQENLHELMEKGSENASAVFNGLTKENADVRTTTYFIE